MAASVTAAPVLSTPESHILNEVGISAPTQVNAALSEEDLSVRYEIQRTLREIRSRKWKRVALQFPDEMLPDAPKVFRLLRRGLGNSRIPMESKKQQNGVKQTPPPQRGETDVQQAEKAMEKVKLIDEEPSSKLFILADTSYGSCCVDEIAAEHVNADSIVHYGRACLSPTARLPVLYIFTINALELNPVIETFKTTFPNKNEKIVLAADVLYSDHVQPLFERLRNVEGYMQVVATSLIHDPSSSIPNRSLPSLSGPLSDYSLFHLSQPPTALLLTMSSRVCALYIYPTNPSLPSPTSLEPATTLPLLRRRYFLVTSLASASTWGILINTLSVTSYLPLVQHLHACIVAAGKISYTFVVGKLNAAKLANFAEVEGWVVVGCWESGLVDSKDFYRGCVTPWELLGCLEAQQGGGTGEAGRRLWDGQWRGDWGGLVEKMEQEGEREEREGEREEREGKEIGGNDCTQRGVDEHNIYEGEEAEDDEEESVPPTFDLRTGRYVSNPTPRSKSKHRHLKSSSKPSSAALSTISKEKSLATIRGGHSAGAAFLREKRTWQGLGSDFGQGNGAEIGYEHEEDGFGNDAERVDGGLVREGRSGLARGYVVGDEEGQDRR